MFTLQKLTLAVIIMMVISGVTTLFIIDHVCAATVTEYLTDNANLWQENPDKNYSIGETAQLGKAWGYIWHEVVKFKLPETPVKSAYLYIYLEKMDEFQDNGYVRIYRVTNEWIPDEVTWKNSKFGTSWEKVGGDYDSKEAAGSAHTIAGFTPGYVKYDITSIVKEWQKGTYPNYGLLINSLYPNAGYFSISTAQTKVPAHRPYVVFETEDAK